MCIRYDSLVFQQSGAEEACWAHNPEVGGSKPPSATYTFLNRNAFFINNFRENDKMAPRVSQISRIYAEDEFSARYLAIFHPVTERIT